MGNYEVIIVGPPMMMKFTGEKVAGLGVPDEKFGYLLKEKCHVQLGNVDIAELMKHMFV